MRVTLSKSFSFDAAHRLPYLPPEHKCRRLHGHTYRVEIRVTGEVNPDTGILIDYAEIEAAWIPLHAQLDHHYLNEILGLENPTTEELCAWIWHGLRASGLFLSLAAVRVYESSTTYCEYQGD